MKYIQRIYEDGRAVAIPVSKIVRVELNKRESGKWYVQVSHIASKIWDSVCDSFWIYESENREDAYECYKKILFYIEKESV